MMSGTDDIGAAVARLRAGGLVALPTETVYGLGADASNPAAIARVFAAKGRPADHPLIVHLGAADWLPRWVASVPEPARLLADAFWPGPLTLVLPRAAHVPAAVSGGMDTLAVRVPRHPLAQRLLHAFGGGIAAPSANRYGRVSPTAAAHVRAEFGDAVMVLDGGDCEVGIESTIVDCTDPTRVRLLRPGSITAEQLRAVLGSRFYEGEVTGARAPGRKPSHYAPRARVVLATPGDVVALATQALAQAQRVGLLATRRPAGLPAAVHWLEFPAAADAQARQLYRRLRDGDARGLDLLLVIPPPDAGLGRALNDRLRRAAGLGDGQPDVDAT